MARLIAGAVEGKPFLEPEKVSGVAHLGQSGVDEWASAVLKFQNGIIAEVSCSIMAQQDNTLRVIGSEGRIEVKDFWFASGHKGGVGTVEIFKGAEQETIEVKEDRWLYSFEVDAAGDAIRAGEKEFASPGMSWADSTGNLRVLDQMAGLCRPRIWCREGVKANHEYCGRSSPAWQQHSASPDTRHL